LQFDWLNTIDYQEAETTSLTTILDGFLKDQEEIVLEIKDFVPQTKH
jgi:hypothetical protein